CNFGREPVEFRCDAQILRPLFRAPDTTESLSAILEPGQVRVVEFDLKLPAPEDVRYQHWYASVQGGGLHARGSLSVRGERMDEIGHALDIGVPGTLMRGLVTARDGRFWVGDRVWIPYGVNYWPSYAIGAPTLQWHGPQYEPAIVEEELATLQSLRMNMVSIQAPTAYWRDLCDFLRRCAHHHIRVNLFLHGADPMRFDRDAVRTLIESAHLADQPALFAYDIAWEPRLGRYNERRRWDREWEQWIVERYGSVENAERDWAFPVPRTDDGRVTAPSDAQVTNDGDHRRMVAAYRRFADDLISSKYRDATRFIRSLDPNHLIGTRTGYGGTGPCHPAVMAFDLASVAKHLDFASPEGWGMTGDRDTLVESGITTAYGRLVTNGKPVMWSEFGMQKWDRAKQRPDPDLVAQEADYYADMYAMMAASGAQGAVPWWWPGGYRVGENSDFGISDPNARPRPVWRAVREYSPLVPRNARKWLEAVPEPDAWITIDRDAHVDGYHGIYFAHKAEYGRLLRAGKFPALRTEGTGTTSANTPLVAVGNVPYNGSNPPKYLNAEFNWVKLKIGDGDWTEITDDATVDVPRAAAVQLTASIGNTAEAKWLAGEGEGRVFLASAAGSDVAVHQPISEDTAHLADAEVAPFELARSLAKQTRVVLEMAAEGRMRFGPKFAFTLRPR
ncbi:MAG: beta-galactosidase, partial [Armatimonadota bacterium]